MRATEPPITVEVAKELGLTEEEFQSITKALGRTPNYTELRIFAVMWSERCSFKNALFWLKSLPREGKALPAGACGEPAGLANIGDGWSCAVAAGTLSHSISVAPFRSGGALAGGAHRSIISFGARPLACLSALRFGNAGLDDTRRLMRGFLEGMADYNNKLGLPGMGSEAWFGDCYNDDIQASAISLGLVRTAEVLPPRAEGPGKPVFIVEPPAVPTGEEFRSKQLMESCLEAVRDGVVSGVQAIGPGGIAGCAAGMCANGKTGMHINLDKLSAPAPGTEAFEMLLSESPERLMAIGKKGEEDTLRSHFEKWGLICLEAGEVTDSGRLEFFREGERIASLEPGALLPGRGAPAYQPKFTKPEYLKKIEKYRLSHIPKPDNYIEAARKLLSSPNIVSRRRALRQPGAPEPEGFLSDAAPLRAEGCPKVLAASMGCNSAYVFADPYAGAMIAVAEAARNVACSGAEPLAIASCLHFGSPDKPEMYWQFAMAVKGIGDACKKLNTSVAASHVSFHQQAGRSPGAEPAYPTPAIGVIGVSDDISMLMTLDFKAAGHQIYMIGTPHNDLGSSVFLRHIHGIHYSPAPVFDMDEEYHVQANMKKLIQKNLAESAHGISGGGLFVALLESAMPRGLGFIAETDANFRKDAYLFGESQSRILITVAPRDEDELVNYLNSQNVSFTKIGEVAGSRAIIDEEDYGEISDWKKLYERTLAGLMEA